ncbi:MAG: DNA methylase [Clostridia bacterium]|nr:DNA methylase [Clostridia bacterium]
MAERTYIAIDLKSFYAAVEAVERKLDPLNVCLVVADEERSDKTICLAVSPALKAYGISGRPRLFEVKQKVREINEERRKLAAGRELKGASYQADELAANGNLALTFVCATPRMAYYMKYSADIYKIYLKYVAPDDIHVYSIDEVFMDVTSYLKLYNMTANDFAVKIIHDVYDTSGITATVGIGPNLYLAKVAMDIVAKHIPADEKGVRIASLTEMEYRQKLWDHRPLTDFWRVGHRYADRLAAMGLFTMGDIARCSAGKTGYYTEDLLYKEFGVNAELLIDHAWGWESCTIADIKAYKPEANSVSSGQVLTAPYDYDKAFLVVREMAEELSLDLAGKGLVTDQIVLTVGYDAASDDYEGDSHLDHYGRRIPHHAHGTYNLSRQTASTKLIMEAASEIYKRTVDKKMYIRRINITAARVIPESEAQMQAPLGDVQQMSLFDDIDAINRQKQEEDEYLEKEKRRQQAELAIKRKYGKNALLKGMNIEEGATMRTRNNQIGGHRK